MTFENFVYKFARMSLNVHAKSNGRIELYWDYLDGDNVVIGVRRTSMPIEFPYVGGDGDHYSHYVWPTGEINDYCDVIRDAAEMLQAALADQDGREWTGARALDLTSWDYDGADEFDEDVEIDGETYNACKAVTIQLYV